jgi:NAD(P)-dependent dehydrogenase (short-subunit alcohol dehydrogenase family)
MDFQAGDVSQEADVRRIVRSVLDAHGRVDILVNNAGFQREAKLTDVTVEDFHAVVNVNLLGAVLLCREVLPGMVERRSGVIVNMSSVLGWVADPLLPGYDAWTRPATRTSRSRRRP